MICALLAITTATDDSPREALVRHLVDALNTKEETRIAEFFRTHGTDSATPEERARRFVGLARQVAPMEILRFGPPRPREVRALVRDAQRNEATLTVQFGPAEPPKIEAMWIRLGNSIDRPPEPDYASARDLSSLVRMIREYHRAPAFAVATLREGKSEVSVDGMRKVGGTEAVGSDEPWSVGSIGKSICASAVARLIEAGKLKFETTLAEALPGYDIPASHRAITLEQLMRHRAGIAPELGFTRPQVDGILGQERDPQRVRDLYIRHLLKKPLITAPNTRFEYSNGGYALLSRIAEIAAGVPYEELVRQQVFAPLALRHSHSDSAKLPEARPHGHLSTPNGPEAWDFRGPLEAMLAGAGGGVWMSISDLARYGQAHLDGLKGKDGWLKSATIRRLHDGVPEEGPDSRRYAAGWGIDRLRDGIVMHGHNGSNGTFMAQLALFPDKNLVVAGISNLGSEDDNPGLTAALQIVRRP